MTCTSGTGCSRSPTCADLDCPGRGTMNDGVDDLGWIVLAALIVIVVVVALMRAYVWWRWMV